MGDNLGDNSVLVEISAENLAQSNVSDEVMIKKWKTNPIKNFCLVQSKRGYVKFNLPNRLLF